MKIFTGLLSIAVVGGLLTGVPARADTVYHRVYRQPVTATDDFSILDTHQNNALSAEDYKNGHYTADFAALDVDKNKFLSRSEFYRTGGDKRKMMDFSAIAPAAGGPSQESVPNNDIVYRDDPCDVTARRNEPYCR